jgi:iron-sulfur cluster assembly accessory protein
MLELTESAAEYVKKLLELEGLDEKCGLHVFVKAGGCAGFEYGVELIRKPSRFELIRSGDKVIVSHGVRILTDDKSLLFIKGSVIGWEQVNLGHQFTFDNPNSSGSCGCGVSFSA